MLRMTNKKVGILLMVMLVTQIQVNAGWLSNLGQRIVNGAINTVQTNISGKVNRIVDDVMDGKVGNKPTEKKTNQKSQETSIQTTPDSKVSGQPSEEAVEGKITSTTDRGKAIKFTNNYQKIDLGTMSFVGEKIYSKTLDIGQKLVKVDEFLDPGYYVIWINSKSYTNPVSVVYTNLSEGVTFGYGIVVRKRIFDNGYLEMKADKDNIMYVVEVLKNTQGNLDLSIVNDYKTLSGSAELSIFKIPGPTLK